MSGRNIRTAFEGKDLLSFRRLEAQFQGAEELSTKTLAENVLKLSVNLTSSIAAATYPEDFLPSDPAQIMHDFESMIRKRLLEEQAAEERLSEIGMSDPLAVDAAAATVTQSAGNDADGDEV